jgi:alkane 1-monooxygenase
MTRATELRHASGYLLIFAPPALLAVSMWVHMPLLAFVGLIIVAPFCRAIFGDASDRQLEWTEGAAKALELLPMLAACAFFAALVYTQWMLWRSPLRIGELVEIGFSLWATCVFTSCVAHELVHRKTPVSRALGRLFSGALGYPLLEHEHRAHHAETGLVAAAEWPAVDESLWRFTARRSRRVLRTAWEGDTVAAARHGNRLAGGLPLALSATAATAAGFWLAAGLSGLMLYAIVVLAVAWAVQAITYLQHWGLGDGSAADAGAGAYGWEDRCQLQAWLTLSISYHQAHHHQAAAPYYRLQPRIGSPRQPGGYVVLLFASMVPPLWRALMLPALQQWRDAPEAQRSAGRGLFCFARRNGEAGQK